MGDSPTDDDVERVINNYVDPDSTDDGEAEGDLEDAGFTQSAIDAFSDRILDTEDVTEAAENEANVGVLSREDVEEVAERTAPGGTPDSRAQQVARDAAQDMGAPSESNLRKARAQAAQNVEGSKLKSNPDLDPLAEGGEGREILDIQESNISAGKSSNYETGDLREGVEKTGPGKGTFYLERRSTGERFPVSEVDL